MSCRWDYLGKTKHCRKWGTRVPLRQRRTRNTKNKNKSNRKFGIQDKMTTEARFFQRWPKLNPQSQSFYVCFNTTTNIWKWKWRFLGYVHQTPTDSTPLFQCWVSFAAWYTEVFLWEKISQISSLVHLSIHTQIRLGFFCEPTWFSAASSVCRRQHVAWTRRLKSVDWHVNKHVRGFKRLDLQI